MLLDRRNLFTYDHKPYECAEVQQSFSPCFSSIGILAKTGDTGLGALVLHYNRATRTLFHNVVECTLPYNSAASDFSQLVCGDGALKLSFFDKNAFTLQIRGRETVSIFCKADAFTNKCWYEDESPGGIVIHGYSKNADARDPDESVPFCIYVKVCKGYLFTKNGNIYLNPENGQILFHAVTACLEIDEDLMEATLRKAPPDADTAAAITVDWAKSLVSEFTLQVPDATQTEKLRFSVLGLLFNLTCAEGNLKRHISAFPSRGTYPTHFLWDTCFQNLAYERFSVSLAKDLLLQNVSMQRSDGKFEQFLCSTWSRPHDSQPPLIGWAALRIAQKTGDQSFIKTVLPSLEKNNQWWLTNRITDCGLIYTLGGLETGQDNSPRFDYGPTIAADMNAYLLHQMHACAALAGMIGDIGKARFWQKKAAQFAARIRQILYDPVDLVFYDRRLDTGENVRVLSPSGLLPLWAGDVLPLKEAKAAIQRTLLNEDRMFGKVPFPSVAYCDPTYRADDWWRGPTWMPIAYLMLECLAKYGFHKEKQIAAERLYAVIAADDDVHELFDSATGKGLGAAQQGWTCAIFIELLAMLYQNEDGCEHLTET